jgi:hypothetical protein
MTPLLADSMSTVLWGVAIFILLLAVAHAAKGLRAWLSNLAHPVRRSPARVVAKRSAVGDVHADANRRVATKYFVTFEFRDGERREFSVEETQYGVIAGGDRGTVEYQDGRFHSFDRSAGGE